MHIVKPCNACHYTPIGGRGRGHCLKLGHYDANGEDYTHNSTTLNPILKILPFSGHEPPVMPLFN